jgi:hypothetical protein
MSECPFAFLRIPGALEQVGFAVKKKRFAVEQIVASFDRYGSQRPKSKYDLWKARTQVFSNDSD